MTQPNPDLQDCLDKAVQEWLESTGGGLVTGSVMLVDFVDAQGDQMWAWSVSRDQNMTKSMGLVEWLRGLVRFEQQRFLQDEEGS